MSAGVRGIRIAGLIAIIVGACCSVVLTLYAGRHSPRVLVPLFVLWVLSPFVGLGFASGYSGHWSDRGRAVLFWTMVVVSALSPAIYASRAFGPPRPQGAFVFVAFPAVSWVVLAGVYTVGWLTSRGR